LVENQLQTTPTSGLDVQSPLWPRQLSGDWFQGPRPL